MFFHFPPEKTSADIALPNGYKSEYYKALSSEDSSLLNGQMHKLNSLNIEEKQAYLGTLTMKKAEFVKTVAEKIRLFNHGRKQLESAIKQRPQNAEYRFLRLSVQENCPPILKYNQNIREDAQLIRASYKGLEPEVRSAILDYCKISRTLKKEEF